MHLPPQLIHPTLMVEVPCTVTKDIAIASETVSSLCPPPGSMLTLKLSNHIILGRLSLLAPCIAH